MLQDACSDHVHPSYPTHVKAVPGNLSYRSLRFRESVEICPDSICASSIRSFVVTSLNLIKPIRVLDPTLLLPLSEIQPLLPGIQGHGVDSEPMRLLLFPTLGFDLPGLDLRPITLNLGLGQIDTSSGEIDLVNDAFTRPSQIETPDPTYLAEQAMALAGAVGRLVVGQVLERIKWREEHKVLGSVCETNMEESSLVIKSTVALPKHLDWRCGLLVRCFHGQCEPGNIASKTTVTLTKVWTTFGFEGKVLNLGQVGGGSHDF
jgi:hypothetical protein